MQIVYIFETSISVDDFELVIEMYNIIASTFNILTNNDNIGFSYTVAMALIPCLGEGGGWEHFAWGSTYPHFSTCCMRPYTDPFNSPHQFIQSLSLVR